MSSTCSSLALAKSRLARLAKRWPERGDVLYLLGAALLAEGHIEPALEVLGPHSRACAGGGSRRTFPRTTGRRERPLLDRRTVPRACDPRWGPDRRRRALAAESALPDDRTKRPVPPGTQAAGRTRARSLANSALALEQRARCAGDRGNQRVAGTGPARGSRRRPRLAGPRKPGDAHGKSRRGRPVARPLRASTSRRSLGMAGPAGLGAGRRAAR